MAGHRLGQLAGSYDDDRHRAGRNPPHQAEGDDPGQWHRDCRQQAHDHDLPHGDGIESEVPMGPVSDHRVQEPADQQRVQDAAQIGEHAEGDAASCALVQAVAGEHPDEQWDHGQVEVHDRTTANCSCIMVCRHYRHQQGPEHGGCGQTYDVCAQQTSQHMPADLGHRPSMIAQVDGHAGAGGNQERVRSTLEELLYLLFTNCHVSRPALPYAGNNSNPNYCAKPRRSSPSPCPPRSGIHRTAGTSWDTIGLRPTGATSRLGRQGDTDPCATEFNARNRPFGSCSHPGSARSSTVLDPPGGRWNQESDAANPGTSIWMY